MSIITRNITELVTTALRDTPIVVINGARQVGKSTLVKELVKEGLLTDYITLDNLSILGALKKSPKSFLERLPHGTIIDEIQKAPEIFPTIKEIVDEDRSPGRFVLTGSANIFMLPKLSESLAGRMEVLTLDPFTQGELIGVKESFIDTLPKIQSKKIDELKISNYIEMVLSGGYPELIKRKEDRRKPWVDNYTSALIQRDILDISKIQDITSLPIILTALADQSGNLLNVSNISRKVNIKRATLIRYISILKTLFLVFELQPYFSRNITKRLIKSPKIYSIDSGIMTQLLGITKSRLDDPTEYGLFFGKLLENYVVTLIKRQISWSKSKPRIYYLRSEDGSREIDIILEFQNNYTFAIEIKSTSSPKAEDWKHIKWFKDSNPHCIGGAVIYLGNTKIEVEKDIWLLPLQTLWT